MKIVRGVALGLAALTMFGSAALAANSPVTVGDFLTAYAKAMKIELPASTTPDAVAAALKASGVKLDSGLQFSQTLTQADVVKIGRANGLKLTTHAGEAPLTSIELDQFFAAYGATLANAGGGSRVAASDLPPGDPENHANTDKGKKKGRPFQSPTEPE